ncbi:hypothetical protein EC9_51640 [Rosistilla ulvae]|uniref:Uncharacterized protein n=1 Tax=Rosistilla ulvae TaxID=1930277 RepID=A0A517M7U9_9BACT|nr:hypothetical protein EC9_51640 [Rosistilla ulvae]
MDPTESCFHPRFHHADLTFSMLARNRIEWIARPTGLSSSISMVAGMVGRATGPASAAWGARAKPVAHDSFLETIRERETMPAESELASSIGFVAGMVRCTTGSASAAWGARAKPVAHDSFLETIRQHQTMPSPSRLAASIGIVAEMIGSATGSASAAGSTGKARGTRLVSGNDKRT